MRSNWQEKLNEHFAGKFGLLSLLHQTPVLRCIGSFDPPKHLNSEIERHRQLLSQPGRYNELQALVVGEPNLAIDTVQIEYQRLDYATVRAMREVGQAGQVVSTSSLPVCPERKQIVVQKRGTMSDLLPGKLHTFSGAWQAPQGADADSIGEGLPQSALRELHEETGVRLAQPGNAQPALFRDLLWGATEYCLLGVELSEAQWDALSGTEEGEIVYIDFDDLPNSLTNSDGMWTDGGRPEVLTWLAIGAPPVGPEPIFGGMTAEETFWDFFEAVG